METWVKRFISRDDGQEKIKPLILSYQSTNEFQNLLVFPKTVSRLCSVSAFPAGTNKAGKYKYIYG
jgi:hypothetical protein